MPLANQPDLTCKELVELVTEYLEGALAAPMRARFEAHLALCEGCEAHVQQLKQTISALGRLPQDSVSSGAMAALLEHFRRGF